MKLKPTQELDEILLLFEDQNRLNKNTIQHLLGKKDISISDVRLEQMLHKLIKDNHLRIENNESADLGEYYTLTFDGELLLESGGYENALLNQQNDLERERRNEKYLRWIAIWATGGTLTFLIWDFVKYGHEHDWFGNGCIWPFCR
jgi:hypothetical protein